MWKLLIMSISTLGFVIQAENAPLTDKQLFHKATDICIGQVSYISENLQSNNRTFNSYRVKGVIHLKLSQCYKGNLTNDRTTTVATFSYEWSDGNQLSKNSLSPKPKVGEDGIMYLKRGKVLKPNGWCPI